MTYEYDDWGNITAKSIYPYTTAENPGTPTDTKTYDYDNTQWGDQLTGYNGQTIAYEPVYGIRGLLLGYAGNPISYLGRTLSWHGRELVGITDGTDTISYIYDSNGLRQKKTVNGTDTNYYYNGSVLIGMQQGTNALRFSYDAAGAVAAVDFNGTYYYYVRNGQGDVVKLIDGSRNTVVEYAYDSWGKLLSCTGTLAISLGALNPFRYRGYVYDSETGFYYLKSRYYDPETCRFISADVLLSTGQGVLGHNCYAYCLNNPVLCTDASGYSSIWDRAKNALAVIAIAAVVVVAVAVSVAIITSTGGGALALAGGGIVASGATVTATSAVAEASLVAGLSTLGVLSIKAAQNIAQMIGQNGTKTTNETTWRGKEHGKERLDVENPNPGQRPGRIHYHEPNNASHDYLFDSNTFKDPTTRLRRLMKNEKFIRGLKHAFKILGEVFPE